MTSQMLQGQEHRKIPLFFRMTDLPGTNHLEQRFIERLLFHKGKQVLMTGYVVTGSISVDSLAGFFILVRHAPPADVLQFLTGDFREPHATITMNVLDFILEYLVRPEIKHMNRLIARGHL